MNATSDPTRIAELLQAYIEADYRWELDGRWLQLAVGTPAPEIERAYPGMDSFGLLSAWNPYSVERPEADNRAADEALQAALLASGHVFRAGFSSASNRLWREPSWVVADMPMPQVDALGRQFGQLGVLYWQRGEPVRLRMLTSRPATCAGQPCVDWVE